MNSLFKINRIRKVLTQSRYFACTGCVHEQQKGFSLVELLVSIAIFAIVITMAVGSLMVIIDANARAQNMQEVMVNLNFAIDSMTREIRTGRGFFCSSNVSDLNNLSDTDNQDCVNGGTVLSIVEGGRSLTGVDESRVAYRYSGNNTIERRVGSGTWQPITSLNVNISDFNFYVFNSDSAFEGDTNQAYVIIYIEGWAGELETTDSSFQLQTTITRRVIDI